MKVMATAFPFFIRTPLHEVTLVFWKLIFDLLSFSLWRACAF